MDYTVDSIAGREFGSVFIGSNSSENVALTVAAKGWARVSTSAASCWLLNTFYSLEIDCEAPLAAGQDSGWLTESIL